jgi:hypothetical protein
MNLCDRSSCPFACGSRGSRITHPTSSCPQNAANGSVGGRQRDRCLAAPHQLLRPRTELPQVSCEAPEDVGCLLAEGQCADDRTRPATLTRHHPATAALPVTDRDVLRRFPQIALHQLARPIDRPLKRPRRQDLGRTSRTKSSKILAMTAGSQARRPSRGASVTESVGPRPAAHRSSP